MKKSARFPQDENGNGIRLSNTAMNEGTLAHRRHPHSEVTLVFTGISASLIAYFDPDGATVFQATIAVTAAINEVIAVLLAR